MEVENEDHFANIPELAKLLTYSVFIAILFGVIHVHLYYYVLLHIPIFEYIETSEIILLSGSTGVSLVIYYIGINLPSYFINQTDLNKFQKATTVILSMTISGLYFWFAYRNDPIIREMVMLPLRYWWLLIFLIVFLMAFNHEIESTKKFMSKHRIYQPILLAIWWGLFIGYAHYNTLLTGKNNLKFTIKLKSGKQIKTTKHIVYAGRIQNFWFIYNRETKTTRIIKNDEVDVVDIDSKNE